MKQNEFDIVTLNNIAFQVKKEFECTDHTEVFFMMSPKKNHALPDGWDDFDLVGAYEIRVLVQSRGWCRKLMSCEDFFGIDQDYDYAFWVHKLTSWFVTVLIVPVEEKE